MNRRLTHLTTKCNCRLRHLACKLLCSATVASAENETCTDYSSSILLSAAGKPLPSVTPPVHLPSFFSQSTVPKLVARNMLTLKDDNFSNFCDNASRSSAHGNVFFMTPCLGFWTWSNLSACVHEQM